MRCPLVMGNWKLHGSVVMVNDFFDGLRNKLGSISGCKIAIAPPVLYLAQAQKLLADSGSDSIALGAQNVDVNLSGAYTGEVSAEMLKDVGAKYAIIGHSERRTYHKESNELIAEKFKVLKDTGLIPVLCIGETEAENEAGQTKAVCAKQLDSVLNTPSLGVKAFKGAVIAYEPVWAIGTGKSATPEEAQAVHKFIRGYIHQKDAAVADEVVVQYGGSVNASNAEELFAQPDIDGALVGGASLKADIFAKIVKAAAKAKKS